MAEPTLLDRTFAVIMNRMVETGQAPHHAEIAAELGVSPEAGRAALHALFSLRGFPGWLFPGKTVRIDSLCLDCGEPIRVEVKDGAIEAEEPTGLRLAHERVHGRLPRQARRSPGRRRLLADAAAREARLLPRDEAGNHAGTHHRFSISENTQ